MIRSDSSGVIRVSAIALLGFLSLLPQVPRLCIASPDNRSVPTPETAQTHIGEVLASIEAPLTNGILTSGFGLRLDPFTHTERFHRGIDIAAADGTPIRSIGFGVVAYAGDYAGYGKLVVIDHGNGLTSHYAHLRDIAVQVGQNISSGSLLGNAGTTGRVTGPHLHLELRVQGQPVNPEGILVKH